MADANGSLGQRVIHPVHAVLLASSLPLFLGALLSDLAYGSTYQVQWTNFASWLIAGGLIFTGLALVWALIDLFRADFSLARKPLLYFLLLLGTFVVGLLNALVHSKDAWAVMPEGPIFSALVVALAAVTIAIGFSTLGRGAAR